MPFYASNIYKYPRLQSEAPRGRDYVFGGRNAGDILLRNPSFFHLKYYICHIHSGFPV